MRRHLATACACLALASCSTITNAWLTGWTDSAANDRIMLIRDNPPSLGWQRLERQAKIYQELAAFLHQHGHPDFLAETANEGQRYLVLYYLDHEAAWAGRTKRSSRRIMEFSGPHPVTRNELRMLRDLKQGKSPPGLQPVPR